MKKFKIFYNAMQVFDLNTTVCGLYQTASMEGF